MEISRNKPGFWEIAPVAQKPGFSQNLGWVAKYLERNPVSLKLHQWLRNRVSHKISVGWLNIWKETRFL
jgi:hypothetical protein